MTTHEIPRPTAEDVWNEAALGIVYRAGLSYDAEESTEVVRSIIRWSLGIERDLAALRKRIEESPFGRAEAYNYEGGDVKVSMRIDRWPDWDCGIANVRLVPMEEETT